MSTVDVVVVKGDKVTKKGSAELPAELFDVQVNIPLIHQVVVAQLAAARQGTHKVKRRGEVSGGGAKPYKQKGTGRARQGSTRAPQFAGGGVVHGPTPRDYSQRTPKKMKAAALRGALSDRAREGRVHVIDVFSAGDVPSTKAALAALNAAGQLNTYDGLVSDDVVFSKAGLEAFLSRSKGVTKPDLSTPDIPGEPIPSIAPAEGDGTVDTEDVK